MAVPTSMAKMPRPRLRQSVLLTCLLAVFLHGPGVASAQIWPRTPVSLAGGRVTLGVELSVTYGSDDEGYFNYTNYETSALRRTRAAVAVSVAPWRRLAMLGEFRLETDGHPRAYAWYARLTPWPDRAIVLQAGRIPPVFGTFARRGYPQDNPLIGDPLAYQYLTSVRHDALPETAADIVRMRGRGWRVTYPAGNTTPLPGVPIVAASSWDTGVQARFGDRPVEFDASWTTGSLSAPGPTGGSGRGGVAGRVAVTPTVGLVLGGSAARGPFLSQRALDATSSVGISGGQQTAFGLDAEYARGYVLLRGEWLFNRWSMPTVHGGTLPLDVSGGYLEGRYRLRPDVYVAARVDRLSFATMTTPDSVETWEARVSRVELGTGYSITRGMRLKACYQFNVRDGGRVRRNHLVAAQAVVWF
jgi:hypothetical protein